MIINLLEKKGQKLAEKELLTNGQKVGAIKKNEKTKPYKLATGEA